MCICIFKNFLRLISPIPIYKGEGRETRERKGNRLERRGKGEGMDKGSEVGRGGENGRGGRAMGGQVLSSPYFLASLHLWFNMYSINTQFTHFLPASICYT
jgi:hypothetical protein